MAELLAGLADSRRVHDRHEASRVAHEQAIEERFVGVLQLREIDVALEVRRLRVELHLRATDLRVEIVDSLREEPEETQLLALGFGERGRLVEARVVEEIWAARQAHRSGG